MKLIVLGASGRCGSWVVQLANERGHDVTAVVREESGYAPPSDVARRLGQGTDPAFVRSSLADHRTIISRLGVRRGGLSPWASVRSPPNLVQSVMRNVIDGMTEGSRLLWISAGGVGSSQMQASAMVRRMIRLGSIGVAYRDLEAAERMMAVPGLRAAQVRPPGPDNCIRTILARHIEITVKFLRYLVIPCVAHEASALLKSPASI